MPLGATVLVDEMEKDPRRRFKLLSVVPGSAEKRKEGGFNGRYSADGIHWVPFSGNPILPVGTENVHLIRDPRSGKYIAYLRPYWLKHDPKSVEEKRIGAVTTSDDLYYWSEMKIVLTPDSVDDAWVQAPPQRTEFYAMHGFPYGHSYLGIIPLFRIERHIDPKVLTSGQSEHDGPMEGQLITSRDGLTWRRMAQRNPVIPSGSSFDKSVFSTTTMPLVVDDEIWLYYTGINGGHGTPMPPKEITICLAKWRLDGFVSLVADEAPGIVETATIYSKGGKLEINADSSRGRIAVELVNDAGQAIEGYSVAETVDVKADNVRQHVRWRMHDRMPAGRSVRLRFRLERASLYSYTVLADDLSQ
ncbi:MAG: hypothetical protein HY736_26335 [Verrucomicrobia bacterium]|nr:hypothetical protein [Verrucomicrobiota bacterium]